MEGDQALLAHEHAPHPGLYLYKMLKYAMDGENHSTVTFDQYRGLAFEDVPMDYLDWVLTEYNKPRDNAPEFIRLAYWAQSQRQQQVLRGHGPDYVDPEEAATTKPPPRSEASEATRKKKSPVKTPETRKTRGRPLDVPSDFDGEFARGCDDNAGADQRPGGSAQSSEGDQGNREGQESKRVSKQRIFRASVKAKIKEKKRYKRGDGSGSDEYEVDGDPHFETADEDTMFTGNGDGAVSADEDGKDEPRSPKVRLVYGDDYEAVRNLPVRKVRRTTRKRVKGLVHKAFLALGTLMSACAQEAAALAMVSYEYIPRRFRGDFCWVSASDELLCIKGLHGVGTQRYQVWT